MVKNSSFMDKGENENIQSEWNNFYENTLIIKLAMFVLIPFILYLLLHLLSISIYPIIITLLLLITLISIAHHIALMYKRNSLVNNNAEKKILDAIISTATRFDFPYYLSFAWLCFTFYPILAVVGISIGTILFMISILISIQLFTFFNSLIENQPDFVKDSKFVYVMPSRFDFYFRHESEGSHYFMSKEFSQELEFQNFINAVDDFYEIRSKINPSNGIIRFIVLPALPTAILAILFRDLILSDNSWILVAIGIIQLLNVILAIFYGKYIAKKEIDSFAGIGNEFSDLNKLMDISTNQSSGISSLREYYFNITLESSILSAKNIKQS